MNKTILVIGAWLLAGLAFAQNSFSLEDVIQRAKLQSPAFKAAETEKETRYWQYRFYKSNFNPQLRANGGLPSYSLIYFPVRQPDGTIIFQPINQTNSTLNIGLEQPIPFTNGRISANTSANYFNDLQRNASSWNSTLYNIALSQPLFAFNPLKWQKQIEPLRFEESKREFAEEGEFISQNAASLFFDVMQAQIRLQIASFNLLNNDTIFRIEQGRYNIGKTSRDKLLQVELQLLQSQQDVGNARLAMETASLRLRTFIGLRDDEPFDLTLPEEIPVFDVSVQEALQYAKQNRSAYLAFERRRREADREVAQAKGNRFQTTLTASYGLNNAATLANELTVNPQSQQQFNLSFNVPILDWGRNKASMRTAYANKKLQDYLIAQDEVTFEQEIITQVRQFEMLKLQIRITRKSDEVAQERYMVAQNRYLIGKIDITDLNIALREKDAAKNAYIDALKSYWNAYYNLRRLTLFDFARGQRLYVSE
jgi:outer membrane protein TolC